MGATDITNTKSSGDVIDETWYNDLRGVVKGSLLPRDASTADVQGGEDLGSAIYPWGSLYADDIIINGATIDFAQLQGKSNSIVSGSTISTSKRADFLRASGSDASFVISGATVNFVANISGISTTIDSDLAESGLTLAPLSNNTATVNDASLTGQQSSKWQGEDGTKIIIDNAGSEITDRIGQFAVFKTSTEYMLACVESATQLTNVYRGFFLDSAGAPIERVAISDNDLLSIMSVGWVFLENDALTIDVTYNTPTYSKTEPLMPVTGDYWFDVPNQQWKRYNGVDFSVVNRLPIGFCVVDSANCVATRSYDFSKNYNSYNPIKLKYADVTTIESDTFDIDFNIYGITGQRRNAKIKWDITTDREVGVVEAPNTLFYAYLTDQGHTVISDKKPYDERGTLGGWYHPYNSWQCLGFVLNDASSDFDFLSLRTYKKDKLGTSADFDTGLNPLNILQLDSNAKIPAVDASQVTNLLPSQIPSRTNTQIFTADGTWTKPSLGNYALIKCWGAGGGGAGGVFDASAGGGGGSYKEIIVELSSLGSTEAVTVGAGGVADSPNGQDGTESSLGSILSAYGGGGGGNGVSGSGGGLFSNASGGTNDIVTGEGASVGSNDSGVNGNEIGGSGAGSSSSSSSSTAGGSSVSGGGGGAGNILGSGVSTGGISIHAGNGGGHLQDGFAPAGGGGAGNSSSLGGDGARGEVQVFVW